MLSPLDHLLLTKNLVKSLNDGDGSRRPVLVRRSWQKLVVLMRNDFATDSTHEGYVVEVDGQAKADYPTFVKALTAGLQLRQAFPNSHVKLRDAGGETAH